MDKKPKVKHKLPNMRQQALIKNLAKGMSQTDAYLAAGYKAKHANQAAHIAVKNIAKSWPEDLEAEVGDRRSVIRNYILPLMNATENKAALDQRTGKFRYSKPMPAWGPRTSGLDIYCRIAGAYRDESKQEAGPTRVIINTNVELPDPGMVFPVPPSNSGHKPTQDK